MAVTPINSEDRLVQATFAEYLEHELGWDSVYAWNEGTFGPHGTLGRAETKKAVLTRDLNAALKRLNPDLPESAIKHARRDLTVYDVSRSMVQHNQDFYRYLCGGVPVEYRDAQGRQKSARAKVIDFDNAPGSNRFPRRARTETHRHSHPQLQSPRRLGLFRQRLAVGLY